jgi:hypothetical protein
LQAVLIENQVEVRPDSDTSQKADKRKSMRPAINEGEILTELGIWLSGLESFLASGHHSFVDSRDTKALPDSSREFRLVHATLQRCAMLNARLLSAIGLPVMAETSVTRKIGAGELNDLSLVLREATLLSEGLISSNSLSFGEWKAWCNLLSQKFVATLAFGKLIQYAEETGEKFLPDTLKELAESKCYLNADHAELALILPRFGRILRWLNVVGKMLEADEPLKPALLIFSRINEQIFELTSYINNRLERFPNQEAELFASLDAAAYTASIELKKVYTQELAGLARMRPSPSIYARMETAHSLLNEGFQQILVGFARMLDPNTDVFVLFPNFHRKLEQTIILRKELWSVVQVVQAAEKNPEKRQIDAMQKTLREFLKGTVHYLFYKDTETVERFVEEILVTKQNKDLVPILHRLGAYLETLFGQVKLRAVLEMHPFDSKA